MKLGKFFSNNSVLILLVVVLVLGLVYLCMGRDNGQAPNDTNLVGGEVEGFYNYDENSPAGNAQVNVGGNAGNEPVVNASQNVSEVEQPKSLGTEDSVGNNNQLPSECYPKDILNSGDLLPRDAESKWAQAAPGSQGSLTDQNFLTAGFHIGVNTVGQTLRNANYQLRSEPPNPQVKVSPWLQSTIEPDSNRKPLEIGS